MRANTTTTFLFLLILVNQFQSQTAEVPEIEWQRTFGKKKYNYNVKANSIQQTNDGGYIVIGEARYDLPFSYGYAAWIIKLNKTGVVQWENEYNIHYLSKSAQDVQQTNDGGFIIVGYVFTSQEGGGGSPIGAWILKLDKDGNLVWEKKYDGRFGMTIWQSSDGGFIIGGVDLFNDKGWILKVDENGKLKWEKIDGSTIYSIQETKDGGIIAGGHKSRDPWAIKLDNSGEKEWEVVVKSDSFNIIYSLMQTSDEGYILSGTSPVFPENGEPHWDASILKLDKSGNIEWEKIYGGSESERANSIEQTSDGGYIVAVSTKSLDGDVKGNYGGEDFWIMKLDDDGDMVWQQNYGGSDSDIPHSIHETNDGGFIVAGETLSSDGDVDKDEGYPSFWIVKLTPIASSINENSTIINSSINPNPVNDEINISYKLEKAGKVSIDIVDLQGNVVLSIITNNMQVIGEYSRSEDVSSLGSGVYFLRITNEDSSSQTKFVIE